MEVEAIMRVEFRDEDGYDSVSGGEGKGGGRNRSRDGCRSGSGRGEQRSRRGKKGECAVPRHL